ncbi:hypothetical protein GQ43DRAFT_456536 [Delitschia confertaspora ATCC 74209]|uniref:Glycosyl transferase family 25 domain-containing protein n=1 Tax=Delitschia confertaspora ATCC 74209 TaxID=1513339 RepID=A0A9P4JJ26_9PLEO|nr:hypothetical protein GQ43DRAFT_456536 [Delitschia confertaspora ATCC 74209]
MSSRKPHHYIPALSLLLITFFFFFLYKAYRSHIHTLCFYNTVGNATLGFQEILVISAPWRTDRRDAIALSTAYSGLRFSWIDGVVGKYIPEKAFPPGNHRGVSEGGRGSWRAHLDALRKVVQQNLTTALVLEDDADWDIRIKTQLLDFSAAARELPGLLADKEEESSTEHTTIPYPSRPSLNQKKFKATPDLEIPAAAAPSSIPHTSLSQPKTRSHPYGTTWDILWLGHCGTHLPPSTRITFAADATVPAPRHLKLMAHAPLDDIAAIYPPYTRVVHRANNTACTIAYAVTQAGARKMLYEFGVRAFEKGFDFALSDFCDGSTAKKGREANSEEREKEAKERRLLCLTISPPLFAHHFPEKMTSDIQGHGAGFEGKKETRYVRWSVRMNLERLMMAEEEERVEDQWPDTNEKG